MTATKPRPKKPRPKILPPYGVIIEDDDFHTFSYVIMVLQKVFGYSLEKSQRLTDKVHLEGECLVWSGSKEVAELKVDLIRSAGPDVLAEINFPLGCRIEPLK